MAPTALKNGADQVVGHTGRRERLKRQTGYALCRFNGHGATWTDPIPVNTVRFRMNGLGPYVCRRFRAGHIIAMADGGLLMPLHAPRPANGWATVASERRCFVLRFDDGATTDIGRRWLRPAKHFVWRSRAWAPAKRHARVLMRTEARPGASTICVRLFQRRWRELEPSGATPLWGYPRCAATKGCRVLAVYGYRGAPYGVWACISDDGMSWEEERISLISNR